MDIIFPIITFFLFYSGILLLLRGSLTRCLFGVMLLGHAVNMLVFSAPGIKADAIPIITKAISAEETSLYADPLPQALVLTAIVISFGVFAFFVSLYLRSSKAFQSDDIELMSEEYDD